MWNWLSIKENIITATRHWQLKNKMLHFVHSYKVLVYLHLIMQSQSCLRAEAQNVDKIQAGMESPAHSELSHCKHTSGQLNLRLLYPFPSYPFIGRLGRPKCQWWSLPPSTASIWTPGQHVATYWTTSATQVYSELVHSPALVTLGAYLFSL